MRNRKSENFVFVRQNSDLQIKSSRVVRVKGICFSFLRTSHQSGEKPYFRSNFKGKYLEKCYRQHVSESIFENKKTFCTLDTGGPDFQFGVSSPRFGALKIWMIGLSCCEPYKVISEHISCKRLTFNVEIVKSFILLFLFPIKKCRFIMHTTFIITQQRIICFARFLHDTIYILWW